MCNSRYYDVISVAASILLGIALTILSLLNVITATILTPVLALILGGFSLAAVVYAAGSAARQSQGLNRCLCHKAVRLVRSAIWLVIVAMFTLIFAITNLIIGGILAFILFTLMVYTFFQLYCFILCLARGGCEAAGGSTAVCR